MMEMNAQAQAFWRRDCEVLGLPEPSVDLKAIKRAYADKLRVTRPDDDAQAYQALREAYDRVVGHARYEQVRREMAAQAEAQAQADGSTMVAPANESSPSPSATLMTSGTVAAVLPLGEPSAPPKAASAANAPDTPTPPSTSPPPPPPPAPPHQRVVAQPPTRATPQQDLEPDLHQHTAHRTPEALCQWVETLAQAGPERVAEALPQLRDELVRLPLPHTQEASVRFADLLLRLEGAGSRPLIRLLFEHFGWTTDFRAERLLGSHRVALLRDLRSDRPLPVSDPQVLRDYAPTVTLYRWLASGKRLLTWRAWLASTLMGYPLFTHLGQIELSLWGRLGLETEGYFHLRKLSQLQIGPLAVMALIAVLVLAQHDNAEGLGAIFVAAMFILPALAFVVHAAIELVTLLLSETRLEKLNVPLWQRIRPWLGLACFVGAGLVGQYRGAVGPHPWLYMGVAVGAGLFLAIDSMATFTAALMLWIFTLLLQQPWSSPLGTALAAVWACTGPIVLQQRLYDPEPTVHPDRALHPGWPSGNIATLVALCTVGLPVLLSWLARRSGVAVVVGPVMVSFAALLLMPDTLLRVVLAPAVLLGSVAVTLVAQRLGWRAGRRLLHTRIQTR